jgi:hypothetical protein
MASFDISRARPLLTYYNPLHQQPAYLIQNPTSLSYQTWASQFPTIAPQHEPITTSLQASFQTIKEAERPQETFNLIPEFNANLRIDDLCNWLMDKKCYFGRKNTESNHLQVFLISSPSMI